MDRQDWAQGLQGMGAWFQGQGPQYMNAQSVARRTRVVEDGVRREAMLKDGRTALLLGSQGKWGEAQGLLQNRMDLVNQLGGDPSGTASMLRMVQEGRHDEALMELKTADDMAVMNGELPAMTSPKKEDKYSSIVTGSDGHRYGISRETDQYEQIPSAGMTFSEEAPKDPQKQTNVLRKSVVDVTKSLKEVEKAYSKLNKAVMAGTAAGDMSAVFAYMKMVDPGSTVREGEQASAQNAAGVPQRIVTLYNNILTGERLSPEQRKDFADRGEEMFMSERETADTYINNILQQADQDGIGRVKILGTERLKEFDTRWGSRDQGANIVDWNNL